MQWLWQMMDRCVSAVCALGCMQIPSFFMQYMQRLAGHTQELNRQLGALTQMAKANGRSLPQYIEKFLQQTDRDFSDQGVWMQSLVHRHADLTQSYEQLQHASPWSKPFVFLAHVDHSIAFGTWEEFTPTLTLSTEAFLYAFVGVLLGSCLVLCVSSILKIGKRTLRAAKSVKGA